MGHRGEEAAGADDLLHDLWVGVCGVSFDRITPGAKVMGWTILAPP